MPGKLKRDRLYNFSERSHFSAVVDRDQPERSRLLTKRYRLLARSVNVANMLAQLS